MAEDWAVDVRRYAPDADDSVIQAIVRHLGIALRTRDASLVSFTDPSELETVRESWLKKKLGLTDPDDVLDAAIARVGERMKDDTTKNRVTVYYLLAEMFGKLGLFGATAAVAAEPEPAPEPVAPPVAPVMAAAAPVAAMAAAPTRAQHVASVTKAEKKDDDGIFGTAFWTLGILGVGILAAAIFGSQIGQLVGRAPRPAEMSAAPAAAPAPVAPAIPQGSGVMGETIDGKPALNVYFGTAEREVAPLGAEAEPLKAYLEANPGERLSVSGYVDPRGDAAFNEQLARDRAVNTKAALVAAGIPEDRIDLDKPADIVGGDASLAEDRRVTVRIKVLGIVQEPVAVEKTAAMP
ncbi:DUF2853 family protein [Thermaurantiacus sp.]